nr:VanW family protein [uncultured Pseudomonas sp.]
MERSNHSFDRFPDEGRVLPFGSGAAIFYNYVDLVLHNPTDRHFQLKLKLNVGEQQLEGELLCDRVRGGVVSHLSGWASVFARGWAGVSGE